MKKKRNEEKIGERMTGREGKSRGGGERVRETHRELRYSSSTVGDHGGGGGQEEENAECDQDAHVFVLLNVRGTKRPVNPLLRIEFLLGECRDILLCETQERKRD